jgi:glycosyltransferase involved in cell wall biosynthesis
MNDMGVAAQRLKPTVLFTGLGRPAVAVWSPCYNEARTIGRVVRDFASVLPNTPIYVYDNNSRDDSIGEAMRAGAIVRREEKQGKGNVVRRMFADIDADIYVLADGDDTYETPAAPGMIQRLISGNLDMVNGARQAASRTAYRRGHQFGNTMLNRIVAGFFGDQFTDMLSGYRVFSRRFVKSFPALAKGFEIETEFTVHALELRMPVDEVLTDYRERPDGSESKLRTFHDGFRILWMIVRLLKEERPLYFFGAIFGLCASMAIILMAPVFLSYMETGLVARFPTAILSSALMLLGFISLACGLILDTVTHGRKELKRLKYLEFASTRALFADAAGDD